MNMGVSGMKYDTTPLEGSTQRGIGEHNYEVGVQIPILFYSLIDRCSPSVSTATCQSPLRTDFEAPKGPKAR